MRLALGLRTHDLTTRALVVGVVPVRPPDLADCLSRAERMVVQGADLLDVGAVPAGRGGGDGVPGAEELDAVAAAVEALRQRLDVPVSCATTRAAVARAAFAAGAVMGIDPSGLSDPDYVPAALEAGAAVVAGHPGPGGPDVVTRVAGFLAERGRWAGQGGLPPERIVVDPGVDRCAEPQACLALLRRTPALARLGHPVLVSVPPPALAGWPGEGPGAAGADDRREAAAVGAVAVVGGARLLRTGDVRAGRRVADVVSAILAAP